MECTFRAATKLSLALFWTMMVSIGAASAGQMVIYDSIPSPLPTNLVSEGYQCCQLSEFGDEIQFAGTYRDLSTVTLTLSDWATYSTYSSDPSYSSAGWSWPLTLTLYNVGSGNSVGSVIASETITPTILWRPESDDCGGDPTAFTGSDGSCVHGLAQNVSFDFTGVAVPDQIIFGLSFNTQTYGANPVGIAGPYNSLNFALNDSTSVGSEVDPGSLFLNDHGYLVTTGTADVFSQNQFGAGFVPAIQFDAVPEPSSISVLGVALLGLVFIEWRRRRNAFGG